jgi:hypothetical protein
MTEPRFTVTELAGYLGDRRRPGITYTVLDRAFNYAVVATYRTEDRARSGHGTDGSYRRGCRCELCCAAKREYLKAYRAGHRRGQAGGHRRAAEGTARTLAYDHAARLNEWDERCKVGVR